MTQFSWLNGASFAPIPAGAIAAAAYAIGTSIFDNTAAKMSAMDLRLNVTSVAPTAGGTIAVYLIPSIDGTNYTTPPGTSASAPPPNLLAGTYVFTGAATTIIDVLDMPMGGAYKYEVLIWNNSSASITVGSSLAQPKTPQMT